MIPVSRPIVLAALVCAPPLDGQVPESDWNSPRAVEIAARAIEAREHAFADSSLLRFRARAQGHIYFLGDFRGEREVARADQVALDVRWQAPDRSIQTIVGRRHEHRLPTNVRYHIDHLSLVLDNFRDRIMLGEGEEVRGVLHPAAPGAPGEYEYRLADSLEIRIRDRTARVYRLDVRPEDHARAGVVGSMFVDRGTGAIARLRITFTAAAYRDPELESIALDLRSAMWDGRYWLPAEQDVEIRRSVSWLDFPLASIIRTRLVVQDYELNGDDAWRLGPGQRVATLGEPELEAFRGWTAPLYGGPLEGDDRSDAQLDRALRDARSLARPGATGGGERLRFSLPDASSAIRLRRAEGVLVGGGGRYRIDDRGSVSVWGGYAAGGEQVQASASLDRELGPLEARLEGFVRGSRDVGWFVPASGVERSVGLALEGDDWIDPYHEDGARLSVARGLGAARLEAGVSVRRQRSAHLVVEALFMAEGPLRPVRPIDSGELVALDASADVPLGEALGARWSLAFEGEGATAAIGSFGFTRGVAVLEARRDGLGAPWSWSMTLTLGASGGEVPAQRLFLLGGRGTLPGYPFRAWGGDRVALWRGDVARVVAWPWVTVRLTGAAGRADVGGPGREAAERFGVVPTGEIRPAAGLGVGLIYDLLRVDLFRGLPRARPGDPSVGDWALLITLNPLLLDIL